MQRNVTVLVSGVAGFALAAAVILAHLDLLALAQAVALGVGAAAAAYMVERVTERA